jgi:type III secretion regulatory protein HpaA
MSAVTSHAAAARADALAQTERTREEHAQNDARADHQATLYRGHTTFTHAHRAHAKLLGNKMRANKMRARLAQARKARAARRGKFAAPRKTNAPMLRHANAHGALRSHLHRASHGLRVTRDGGRGGRQGGQQGQGQGQGQSHGDQQRDRRERSFKRAASNVASADTTHVQSINARDSLHLLADACCDALLALRDELAENPHARIDMPILRLARDATVARLALNASHESGFDAIRTRLVERATKRGTQTSPRLAHFNLLAGLHLLMMQRPLRRSNAARADNTLKALESRNGSNTSPA